MTPVQRGTLVMGKWLAGVCLGLSIAVLSCLSFFPWRRPCSCSESLQAMFHYGPTKPCGSSSSWRPWPWWPGPW